MTPDQPDAAAVAVAGDRISAVGTFETLRDAGTVDDCFADAFVLPGLIDQHPHWDLPAGCAVPSTPSRSIGHACRRPNAD